MNAYVKRASSNEWPNGAALLVKIPDAIACSIIFADVVNLYFSRLGVIPDVLLLGVSVPAFFWTLKEGIDARRIRLYLVVITTLFVVYVLYSVGSSSYQGFRNAAAIFTVTGTFLFFFRSASYLLRSRVFLVALCFAAGSAAFLWENPFGVIKSGINAAICYDLIAIFFCLTRLGRIKTRDVTVLFSVICVLSVFSDHRTLAGSSVLLLLQYYLLNMNVARRSLRLLMFLGLIVVVSSVIALLASSSLTVFASAFNNIVVGEGERTLMSGRQIVWPIVWKAIAAHPLLGMGPGVVPGDLYFTDLSAHNLYLQLGLQLGYGGFAALLLLFWSLWYAARPTGLVTTRSAENLVTVVITMVVVHSLFDVFLLQNALVIGVCVWMVLGLGLGALAQDATTARAARAMAGGG